MSTQEFIMLSTTRSYKANLPSFTSTSTKNKPAEEEPQVMYGSIKITQDDIQQVTQDDNELDGNVTTFTKDINYDYNKSVNQQHYYLIYSTHAQPKLSSMSQSCMMWVSRTMENWK
jgi:hypothetical protein